jgi:hypothetical protein
VGRREPVEVAVSLGPVEYLILGFPGNNFTGEVAPALSDIIDRGIVRVLDLVFVTKDRDGNTVAMEFDDHEALRAFGKLEGDVGGLLSREDIEYAADALEPNSSAALLVWEDTWATRFVDAVRDAGGVVLEGARIPHDLLEPAAAGAGL